MFDVVVLGAGAAGLFAAAVAASRGRSVCILEHNDRPGKKIRISGGGRCNFTNIHTTHRAMVSENPEFARSALSRYTPQDFCALVDSYGIAWHEKTLGQLFCDGSAQQIIDMLTAECERHGVSREYGIEVRSVEKSDVFSIHTPGSIVQARSVIVATGGLSIPSLGASDVGYRIARHFSIPVVPCSPALVPLTFGSDFLSKYKECPGVSVDVLVSVAGVSFRENMLFTHRGLSGPAILQISSYLTNVKGAMAPFTVDMLPDTSVEELFPQPNREPRDVGTVLATRLPRRLVQAWHHEAMKRRTDQCSKSLLADVVASVKQWHVLPQGNEGYAKAEVTRGGVSTAALHQKTMESRTVQGLYFIGEVVDITGWLGGYNFQWAWSSAYVAGQAV
jgi:predicted Rossmann fold flavoprotein